MVYDPTKPGDRRSIRNHQEQALPAGWNGQEQVGWVRSYEGRLVGPDD